MRVPIGWLAEYVDVPAGTTVEDLDTAFVRLGLEVEEIHRPEPVTGPLVVGRVLEIEELTGFKKPIRFTQVDVGEAEPRGIVCGARNFAAGDAVVVALPGAVLPGGFAIASRTTYDRISDGMICSVRELGIGDDHAGILVLGGPGDTAPAPGTPAGPLVGLDDVVIELAVTPDRGYCLSMRGLAREMGTGLGVDWRDPGALTPPAAGAGEPAWQVRVEDADRCDRFSMIALEGLDPTAPSPWWMRRRLAQAGVRSISLAVDVTNYVMLELGQPMHAFDRDAVTGPIVVRRAREGERLTTLDGTDRALDADDLLITDDSGPIGLAAVMGGASTEIGDGTRNVLLEAAHWEPTGVARAARRHRLPSEAAKRFERGVDPEMTSVALARAAALLVEYGGARVVGTTVDVDTRGPRPVIELDAARPGRTAGVDYPQERVVELLTAVGCAVEGEGSLRVTPPSWRSDLTDPADLVEEVVRLAGYDEIPSILPTAPPGGGLTETQRRRRAIGRALAETGYVEAPSYPFVGEKTLDALGLAADDERRQAVLVRNPLSEEEPALRTTLLPGLLAALARNLARGQRDLALFEHGAVFPGGRRSPAPLPGVDRRPDDETLAALLGAVPEQPWHVAVALTGARERRGWWGPGRPAEWADAVEAARRVAAAAGVELTVRAGERTPWHPGRCAELLVGETVVGHAGELHPRVCAALELPARTAAMELDVDALPARPVPSGPPISTFPPVLLDLAFVAPPEVAAADVERALREGAGELLESLRLFDVYTGAPVPEGQSSLAYALTLRAPDRTLTGEEAAEVRQRAIARVGERTGRFFVAEPTGALSGVALVTGASSGIGRALAEGLAARGMAVAGLARSGDRLRTAMDEIAAATGARTLAVTADVTDRAGVDAAVEQVTGELGRVDLLVNNAGGIDAAEEPLWETDPDQWWDVVSSQLRGAYLMSRAVVPWMLLRNRGRIVNLASGMSVRARPQYSAYSVAKTGLMRMTEALEGALEGSDVHVFDVAPGVVDTPMTRSMAIWQGFEDWTPVERVVRMVAAIAAGEVDAWGGRYLHVNNETPADLAARAPEGDARRLRLRPWGDDDPLG